MKETKGNKNRVKVNSERKVKTGPTLVPFDPDYDPIVEIKKGKILNCYKF